MAAINIILKAIDQYSQTVTGLNQGFDLVGKAVNKVKVGLEFAFSAMKGLYSISKDVASSFNTVGQTFEALEIRFNAVFGAGELSEKALQWATQFGAKTPLALDQVADRMVKLKSAGFDPLDESLGLMQKLGDTTFALDLDFERLLNPLRKLNSGGKATFESINQLAEAGIPIYDILNKTMGMTADQVQKIADKNISGRDIVYKIIDGISERYTGAMEAASNTSAGAISTIKDIFTVLQKEILDAGIWDRYVKKIVDVRDFLSKTLGSQTGQTIAKGLGEAFSGAFDLIEQSAKYYFAGASGALANMWAFMVRHTQDSSGRMVEPLELIAKSWNALVDEINSKPLFALTLFSVKETIEAIDKLITKLQDVGKWLEDVGISTANLAAKVLGVLGSISAKAFEIIGKGFDAVGEQIMNFYRVFGGSSILSKIGLSDENLVKEAVAYRKFGKAIIDQGKEIEQGFNFLTKTSEGYFSSVVKSNEELKISDQTIKALAKTSESAAESIAEKTSIIPASWVRIGGIMTAEMDRALQKIDSSFRSTFTGLEADIASFIGNTGELLDGFNQDLDGMFKDLDDLESEAIKPVEQQEILQRGTSAGNGIQDTLAAANWPAEFAAMGEFMFKWVLSVASGSSLPMAVTTTP